MIEDDKAKKTFGRVLLREELFSREQRLLQAQLGVKLSEPQARLFAFACRRRGASLADAKAVTGHSGPEARKVLDALAVQDSWSRREVQAGTALPNTSRVASTPHSLVSRRVTKSQREPRAWSVTNPSDLTPTWSLPR